MLVVCFALFGVENSALAAPPEVRGTWLTSSSGDAIASPEKTAETMRRLREIGINTVYVEAWKDGYTQFPSKVLERTIGVDRRPDAAGMDAGDPPRPARDLLQEATIEAHRNGLLCIAWFEYGFVAAHKDTDNHLRRMHPQWLSRDKDGSEVAPNGYVWMNPLHPECRRFLIDVVIEAVDRYDLDGVQFDDRIVWPHTTMGYDEFTVAWYRNEHAGAAPPDDPKDPAWMRWRAEKIEDCARQFARELREKRPGLIVSLSPAPYPWSYENYLSEWPKWAAWAPGNADNTWWDEFVPQCYRYDWPAFKKVWDEQVQNFKDMGAAERVKDMLAGVMIVGSRPEPVAWEDLRQAIEHVRATGGGGHVWWFSKGVLDVYPQQVAAFYDVAGAGAASHPDRPADWRPAPIALTRQLLVAESPDREGENQGGKRASVWRGRAPTGAYRVIVQREGVWAARPAVQVKEPDGGGDAGIVSVELDVDAEAVELLVDRRPDMARAGK
jgi:uncharacterized lipoprotein YddW (UPF0748 family)